MRDEGVELVGGVLILVPQPGEAHAHPEGGPAHALRPDGLVQPRVNPHVLRPHLLLSKLLNLLKEGRRQVINRYLGTGFIISNKIAEPDHFDAV